LCAVLAATDEKSPAKSSRAKDEVKSLVERVAQASKVPWPGWRVLKPMGDWAQSDQEAKELADIYAVANDAWARVQPGPDAGAQREAIKFELTHELESFLQKYTNSAWTPAVSLQIAQASLLRSGYSKALQYYSRAWEITRGNDTSPAKEMSGLAANGLAKVLVVTGRVAESDALEAEVAGLSSPPPLGPDWFWAKEFKRWIKRNPQDAFKCGLYCLDQMGRLTQSGQFLPKDIVETVSTPEGFSAAELVQIGTRAGLQVRAASLNNFAELPIPCVVHLQSQHFVVVRERRGDFYQVLDPVALGRRWLLASEIAEDSSGCLLVSAYSTASPTTLQKLTTLPSGTAAAYRGKCHGGIPFDINDTGCDGSGGSGSASNNSSSTGDNSAKGGGDVQKTVTPETACLNCRPAVSDCKTSGLCDFSSTTLPSGSPQVSVSQPYLNAWIRDLPMEYTPPYGLPVQFHIAFNGRRQPSNILCGFLIYETEMGRKMVDTFLLG
jgi:hypothetical protein